MADNAFSTPGTSTLVDAIYTQNGVANSGATKSYLGTTILDATSLQIDFNQAISARTTIEILGIEVGKTAKATISIGGQIVANKVYTADGVYQDLVYNVAPGDSYILEIENTNAAALQSYTNIRTLIHTGAVQSQICN